MCSSQVGVLLFLKINNRMGEIVRGIVKEGKHRCSNKLRAALCNGPGESNVTLHFIR